jgi:hypothetical protein
MTSSFRDEGNGRIGGSHRSTSSDGNHSEGLIILSHPRDQGKLEAENKALREKNRELRKTLASYGVVISSDDEHCASANEDIISGEADPIVRTELRKLKKENEELKSSLLELRQQQKVQVVVASEVAHNQAKEQAMKTVKFEKDETSNVK